MDKCKYETCKYKQKDKGTCYICGVKSIILGIDRKDSTIGYTTENSYSCCATCNMMKVDTLFEEFIENVKKINIPLDITLWNKMKAIPKLEYKWGFSKK